MSDHMERLANEQFELDARMQKLEAFLESDAFDVVDPNEQHMLVQQQFVMELYNDILKRRLRYRAEV